MTDQINGTVIPIFNDDKIYFTLFRSNKPVVKSYKADFSKTASANMYQANYFLQSVSSLSEFDTYLNRLSDYDTITLGVTQKTTGLSLTSKKYRERYDCIYRGKEHIKFCNDVYQDSKNLSLLLFDIDYDQAMPKDFQLDTPQEVRESLVKLLPLLSRTTMLIRASSSAGIYNSETGEKRSLHNSYHVYIVVANSTAHTNKVFLELIKRRAWSSEVNLAYARLTGAGVVERYYVDLAVLNSAERLIFESNPILEAPLKKENIESVFFEGGALDLSSMNYLLEADYRSIYTTKKAELSNNSSIPIVDISKQKFVSNITIPLSQNNNQLLISTETESKIIKIYRYFKKTKRASVSTFKKMIDDTVVQSILLFLGFYVNHNFKFKLRDEKTASASIMHTGFIKDFGGEFKGSILDFIIYIYKISFQEAWIYTKQLFGCNKGFTFSSLLPNPFDYEKLLTNTTIKKGTNYEF